MGKLSDIQIRNWISSKTHFEMKSDGDGLYISYRENFTTPIWRVRYRFAGKAKVVTIGNYKSLSLSKAREVARQHLAKVRLGHDVALEKQERKREQIKQQHKIDNALTVSQLADKYYQERVLGKVKHPNIVLAKINKDIKPSIGKLYVEEVTPSHIEKILKSIVKRGAPTTANDVLRLLKHLFNQAVKLKIISHNPAQPFDNLDAGGKEESRTRALSREEIAKLFAAMKTAKGFSVENEIAIKLLLILAVRKEELIAAQWVEFDLEAGIWKLPKERSKTKVPIDIPLSPKAIEWLSELKDLSMGSEWVLPARKMQNRMIPHICESTLNVALSKVKHGCEHFTVHDLRRTAKTLLASLGVKSFISERCLNHKIIGVEGIYDAHDYFEERKVALNALSDLIVQLDSGGLEKVIPIKRTA